MNDDTIDAIRRVNPVPVELPAPPIEPLLSRLGASVPRTPRRIGGSGWLVAALSGAVTIAVVVLALVLVGPGRSPTMTTQPPRAVVPAAARPLASILAVLRRPPTVADRNHLLRQMLKRDAQNPTTLGVLGRPVVSLLRFATVAPWGAKIYLVPFLPPTAAAERRLPPKDRGVTTPTTATLATFPDNGADVVAAEIEGGRDIGNMAYGARHPSAQARARWVMIVPDGVTKVAIWQLTTTATQSPKPIVAAVHNNVAAFVAPSLTQPGKELWYGPNGHIVKHIHDASSCAPPLGSCD